MKKTKLTSRNRANALKSTGPRTSEGKAVVSQNARRHGATSTPDPTSVEIWLRIILEAPDLTLSEALGNSPKMQAALSLAAAEARVAQAEASLARLPSAAELKANIPFAENIDEVMAGLRNGDPVTPEMRRMMPQLRKADLSHCIDAHRDRRLLKRYLREALAARRKARAVWVDVMREERHANTPPKADSRNKASFPA